MTRHLTLAVGTLTVVVATLDARPVHAQLVNDRGQDARPVFVGTGDDSGARAWSPPKTQPQNVADVDCWVTEVINPSAKSANNQAALLDSGSEGFVDVTVVNLEALLQWSAAKSKRPGVRNRTAADLVLFLDGKPVKDLHPKTIEATDVRPRVIRVRGESVRVNEHVLHFRFDRAPVNRAWPRNVNLPEPEEWDAVSVAVGVGLPEEGSVRSQSLDPNVPAGEIRLNLVPRWHPTENVPEYAATLDSWVGAFVYDNREQASTQFTYGLGDNLTLALYNGDAYIQWAQSKDRSQASARTIANLVLFIDGRQIPGLRPSIIREPNDDLANGRRGRMVVPVHRLQFNLARTLESNAAWGALLNRPSLYRDVAVSVGFEDLAPVLTNIGTEYPPMKLIVIPTNYWSAGGAMLIVGSLAIFLLLASRSELIRDPALPSKPDGTKPFSLARTQMAFWFFLVFSTYFFIFVITGDKDTIPASILGLIGVSAATAVGSALVDAARQEHPATEAPPSQPITNRQAEIQRLDEERKTINVALSGLTGDVLKTKQGELQKVQGAMRYLRRPRWQNFIYDLLAENETVSFHRFQICVWTLLLGVIFVKEVWDRLAMPEFSATLVGLMGISSGTYVALKERPATKP